MRADGLITDDALRTTDNLVAWAQVLATYCDAGEAFDIDGVPVACVGIAEAMPHAAYVVRAVVDPQRLVAGAMAYFGERGVPGAVIVLDGADAAAEQACVAFGLTRVVTLYGMALALPPVVIPDAPSWLEIRRADDAASHDAHAATDAAAFDDRVETTMRVFPSSLLEAPGYHAYTGYVDGEAVATSTLFVTDLAAGVFGVATVPSHRRRGIGEAMTWHAVREGARLGCDVASLQASPMGRSMYERMGFELNAPAGVWGRG